jgi:hypothetical protein
MKSWKTPTADEINRAIALLAQPAPRRFFFFFRKTRKSRMGQTTTPKRVFQKPA